MSQRVVVVDYGMGNLRSVAQAVQHAALDLPCSVTISSDPETVAQADRLVLPGQGAMRDCMAELQQSGLRDVVLESLQHKPLMGVCVGMQMLLTHSEEQDTPGLNVIPGEVRRFRLEGQLQPDGSRYKVPQMGWNRVHIPDAARAHPMWRGIPDASWFYFVHSYFACPSDAAHSVGETAYGARFTCAIARDNIFATQFHPEKSAELGLALYRNFLQWTP